MSEADDGRLYGLMEVAEGQQAAVQAALEGLAAERAALRREREALARQVQAVEGGARAAVAEGLPGRRRRGWPRCRRRRGRCCPGWPGWRSGPGRRKRRCGGPRSKRTENLCKAVSHNLSRRLALLRHTFATEKHPARLGAGCGRIT